MADAPLDPPTSSSWPKARKIVRDGSYDSSSNFSTASKSPINVLLSSRVPRPITSVVVIFPSKGPASQSPIVG